MFEEIHQLDQVMDKLGKIVENPHNIPDSSEQVITEMAESGHSFCFATPPSSPGGSTLGSRRGSLLSLTSLTSSRASSSVCHADENNHCQNLMVFTQKI